MDIAKDIVDKYSSEQIVAYLDSIMAGVLKNYRTAVEKGTTELLFANLGDIAQVRSVLHEIRKRDEAREAAKNA